MASWTRWTWVWVNSRSWWWTGRPGMLQFMGSQKVGHNWATEQQQWQQGVPSFRMPSAAAGIPRKWQACFCDLEGLESHLRAMKQLNTAKWMSHFMAIKKSTFVFFLKFVEWISSPICCPSLETQNPQGLGGELGRTRAQWGSLPVWFAVCVFKGEKHELFLFVCFLLANTYSEQDPDCDVSSLQKGTKNLMLENGFQFLWESKIVL